MLDGNDIVIISIVNVTCFVFAYHPFAIRWEGISHRRILIHIYPNVYTIASRVRGARNIDGVVCAKSTIVLWSWWSRQTDNQSDKAKKLTRHTHTYTQTNRFLFVFFHLFFMDILFVFFVCTWWWVFRKTNAEQCQTNKWARDSPNTNSIVRDIILLLLLSRYTAGFCYHHLVVERFRVI